jgi:hypothetical protein
MMSFGKYCLMNFEHSQQPVFYSSWAQIFANFLKIMPRKFFPSREGGENAIFLARWSPAWERHFIIFSEKWVLMLSSVKPREMSPDGP